MTDQLNPENASTPDLEEQLREREGAWPKTTEELVAVITELLSAQHSYGSCVYAMSLSAEAAFNYVASTLGASGFQASCANLDFFRRSRSIKGPFSIVTTENYLYPQYKHKHDELRQRMEEAAAKRALEKVNELVATGPNIAGPHPNVWRHWLRLIEHYLFDEFYANSDAWMAWYKNSQAR